VGGIPPGPTSFSIYIFIIAVGTKLNFKLEPVLFVAVKSFWGLTRDFWAVFAEKSCK
jgi:hypothetical protein